MDGKMPPMARGLGFGSIRGPAYSLAGDRRGAAAPGIGDQSGSGDEGCHPVHVARSATDYIRRPVDASEPPPFNRAAVQNVTGRFTLCKTIRHQSARWTIIPARYAFAGSGVQMKLYCMQIKVRKRSAAAPCKSCRPAGSKQTLKCVAASARNFWSRSI